MSFYCFFFSCVSFISVGEADKAKLLLPFYGVVSIRIEFSSDSKNLWSSDFQSENDQKSVVSWD